MSIPVVIQCGGGKLAGIHPVIDLYTGPLWSTLRVVRKRLGRLPVATYVMSAKYGIVPVFRRVPCYDAVLMNQCTQTNHVSPDDILSLLCEQVAPLGSVVAFCGSQLYADTLERTGVRVVRIGGVPFRHGIARAALREYMLSLAQA